MTVFANYNPSQAFSYRRSYVYDLIVVWGYPVTVREDTLIVGTALDGSDIYNLFLKIRDNWWEWSSNGYTLDYPIEYTIATLNGEPYGDLTVEVGFTHPPFTPLPSWYVAQSGLAIYPFTYSLPSPPDDYWLPAPPPIG